uniref:Uncharacterized protein n=1 Tax=Picea glauca TaxID=3330 RepID=A0A101LZC2_PICGL|nr:hypothetical protein ABT39_MTgene5028 [Picea glauca]QHR91989.1 hypothetical protein Q903MT_gene6025 [Picea sitchensis]
MLSLGLELDLSLTLMPMIIQWVDPDLRLSLMLGLDLVGVIIINKVNEQALRGEI